MYCDRSIQWLFAGCLWASIIPPAVAQIIPDDSLGSENSVVDTATINQSAAQLIEGGAVRGENLFHSFENFGVNLGQQVYFANPDGIANILSRVTGDSASAIFGTLGVTGSADLFLLNPHGIVFGENAVLDLNGSFLATTADSFEFANGESYSAVNPDVPLLSINIPVGLQFGSEIGAIEIRGAGHNLGFVNATSLPIQNARPLGLEVTSGKDLALIGGKIELVGGNLTAPGGKVSLGSVGEAGEVPLTTDEGLTFDYDSIVRFDDINLTQASSINLSDIGSGSLQIQAKNIAITENSTIIANTLGTENGGIVNLQATDSLDIIGQNITDFPSAIFSQVASEATGNGSDIVFRATEFNLKDNAFIVSSTAGSGKAGTISLAAERATLANRTSRQFGTGLFSQVNQTATGTGGNITLKVGELLELAGGGQINLNTNAPGQGGSLFLESGRLKISGESSGQFQISSAIITEAGVRETAGNGGDLEINVERLLLEKGGRINSNTKNNGRGGDILIQTSNNDSDLMDLQVSGTSLTNSASSISTSVLQPQATGDGGDLTINAQHNIVVRDSGFISSETKGFGSSGNLKINAQSLVLENGGQISSLNNGFGESGALSIDAKDILVTGTAATGRQSGLFTTISRTGTGKESSREESTTRGTVEESPEVNQNRADFAIASERLTIKEGGAIGSSTSGIVDAADLKLVVTNSLIIEGTKALVNNDKTVRTIIPSSLFTRVEENASGNGGQLQLSTGELVIDRGATISANTFGAGNAGDIVIDGTNNNITVQDSIEIEGIRSGITSGVENPATGDGGDIEITNVNHLVVAAGGSIGVDAKTDKERFIFGSEKPIAAGEINISAQNITISGALADESQLPSRVSAFSEGKSSSGTVTIKAAAAIQILDGAEILVRNLEAGDAGNIRIDTRKLILDNGQLNAEVNAGTQGNVQLTTDDIFVEQGGGINTQATGTATSGNISIDNSGNIFLEDSQIVADATQGNAGNIQIDTVGLFTDSDSVISASSELGIDGVVAINASFDEARTVGAAFPQEPLDSDVKSNQTCEANDDKDNFAYIGRAGLPVNPLDSVRENAALVDWGKEPNQTHAQANFVPQELAPKYRLGDRLLEQENRAKLTEATSWQVNTAGKVELVVSISNPALSGQRELCPASEFFDAR
ncbi:MAG: filamentous hemagglutinin N-terminal domain-containing protein [Cyanobacteria bacterium J06588_4]